MKSPRQLKTPTQRMSIYREFVKILPHTFPILELADFKDMEILIFQQNVYNVLLNNPQVKAEFISETDLSITFIANGHSICLRYTGDNMTLQCGSYTDVSYRVSSVCLIINFMLLLVEKFNITEEVQQILSEPEPICKPVHHSSIDGYHLQNPRWQSLAKKYRHLKLDWGAVLVDEISMPKTYHGVIKDFEYHSTNSQECYICMDNVASSVYHPCAHTGACFECIRNLKQCPICRSDGYAKPIEAK